MVGAKRNAVKYMVSECMRNYWLQMGRISDRRTRRVRRKIVKRMVRKIAEETVRK